MAEPWFEWFPLKWQGEPAMFAADQFNSPTFGTISVAEAVTRMRVFVRQNTDREYRLIVGSDSLPGHDGQVYVVTAIVLHRVGNGAMYFWQRHLSGKIHTLRDRMYAEALASIAMAQRLEEMSELKTFLEDHIEIHVDVGQDGPTRDMIKELVGMIIAHGYQAKTKPESFAASKVADRHTIPVPKFILSPVTN
jgi:predicted RNase H-related nuclease YkuK (DUF458 family)